MKIYCAKNRYKNALDEFVGDKNLWIKVHATSDDIAPQEMYINILDMDDEFYFCRNFASEGLDYPDTTYSKQELEYTLKRVYKLRKTYYEAVKPYDLVSTDEIIAFMGEVEE